MATVLNRTDLKTTNVTLNDNLDSRKDIVISAEFSCFGAATQGGEGFCIYFYGNTSVDTSIGSPGPGLGYAPSDGIVEVAGQTKFDGVNNAVLGVGFDISGKFALPLDDFPTHTYDGDSVIHPNAITLRKGTDDDFSYIGSSSPLSAYNFNIYQVYNDRRPITPTPTPTRTVTHSRTFTNTAGVTPTATRTKTQTPTNTTTRSRTQTKTQTSTKTVSVSVSQTRTISGTKEMYVTATKSPTPTNTKTKTITPSKTATKNSYTFNYPNWPIS